ncbi:unnamed protein product [Linum trigynum]|uniref:Embryo sac development arrest 6 n=1 Tax=Linum trigynum TaxID=586398 RepID=A0AAV2CJ01_9ROSI
MLPPGDSRKRKDRVSTPAFYSAAKPSARLDYLHKPPPNMAPPSPTPSPSSNNGLLAGYLAYEFLTRGTILGEKFDPAKSTEAADSRRIRRGGAKPAAAEEGMKEKKKKEDEERSYAEVASILKTERAHVPGIVNPTQLARWIRM